MEIFTIHNFPDEILLKIFLYLDRKDLYSICRTCKIFDNFIKSFKELKRNLLSVNINNIQLKLRIEDKFIHPRGVCVNKNNNIFVTDENDNIQIFDFNGNLLNSFNNTQFKLPWDICISSNENVLISEPNINRIRVFDKDFRFVKSFATTGNPNFIATTSNNILVTTDANGVEIYDYDGNFTRNFGPIINNVAEYNTYSSDIQGICISSTGNIIISECSDHQISIFDPNGVFIKSFGTYGANIGEFSYPFGLSIDGNDNIYVSDCKNNRIQIFDLNGNFIKEFGNNSDLLKSPTGIYVHNNYIIVAEYDNDRVSIFTS